VIRHRHGQIRTCRRKIAATLASTGTPAFFRARRRRQPWRPRHDHVGRRDAGAVMVRRDRRTQGFDHYSRRFRIALIAVTVSAAARSQGRDVILALPERAKPARTIWRPPRRPDAACARDALAIALLESRGFTAIDFGVFHPRGKPRRALKFVRDMMHTGTRCR